MTESLYYTETDQIIHVCHHQHHKSLPVYQIGGNLRLQGLVIHSPLDRVVYHIDGHPDVLPISNLWTLTCVSSIPINPSVITKIYDTTIAVKCIQYSKNWSAAHSNHYILLLGSLKLQIHYCDIFHRYNQFWYIIEKPPLVYLLN